MATKQVIDVEALLVPIEGENPCGQDISTTTVISELNELRRVEEAENLGEWAPKELKTANWTKVIKITTGVLQTQSKDLRVVGYLVEAYINQYGLAALRDGMQLIYQMHQRFWDYLYPSIQPKVVGEDDEPDEEEESPITVRAAALGKMDMTFASNLPFIRISKPLSDRPALTEAEWKMASYYDNLRLMGEKERKAYDEAVSDGKATGETFRRAVSQSGKDYYKNFLEDYEAAVTEMNQLNLFIEESYREAEELPVFSQAKKTLEDFNQMISEIEKIVGVLRETPLAEASAESEAEGGTPGTGKARKAQFTGDGVPMEPMDREDAIARLRAVATYFKLAEPHSPVTFLVERAVTWAHMGLDQWLNEVVKDETVLMGIRETLGVKPPPPE